MVVMVVPATMLTDHLSAPAYSLLRQLLAERLKGYSAFVVVVGSLEDEEMEFLSFLLLLSSDLINQSGLLLLLLFKDAFACLSVLLD